MEARRLSTWVTGHNLITFMRVEMGSWCKVYGRQVWVSIVIKCKVDGEGFEPLTHRKTCMESFCVLGLELVFSKTCVLRI